MIPLTLGLNGCSTTSFKLPFPRPLGFTSSPPSLKPSLNPKKKKKKTNQQKNANRSCRAELSQDLPVASAIGACILNSLIFPIPSSSDDDGDSSLIDSTDARFAVMGIIGFIPYFNWLSWVFAWLDTGKQRYAVYAIVYLAPYLRSNLSISPSESWLPIASIVLCIIHIQLEASIRNGDLQGFQIFNEALKHFSSRKKDDRLKAHENIFEKVVGKDHKNLSSAEDKRREEIEQWGVPGESLKERQHSNNDWDEDDGPGH